MTDHINRMKREYRELDERLTKLRAFMETPKFASLEVVAQSLLAQQKSAMHSYHFALRQRLDLAGVDPDNLGIIAEHLGEPVEIGDHDIDRDGPPSFSS